MKNLKRSPAGRRFNPAPRVVKYKWVLIDKINEMKKTDRAKYIQ
ncbi:MAG: hypothetical protein ABI688_12020 [Bacteroidota bacterium]